ncbi:MAG: MBL fold metallo-hydrolase [Candidatus Omnitrophica bacterium]|nr:MBL fold metallo-hydrolase [Candidatus Omnitrophota bacterium]
MTEVKRFTVGLLETNCYLVYDTEEKIGFLIDPGTFDKKIAKVIEENNIRIRNIINTHGHADHTSGNKRFGYPILIHEKDSDFLKNAAKNLAHFMSPTFVSPPAERLLKDGDVIKEGKLMLHVIHTPGHTPGGICLETGNRIFTGDTLFRESVGRTDFPYGSEKDLLNSVKKRLMVFPDEIEVLPGHGEGSTIGHERRNNPFLRGVRDD